MIRDIIDFIENAPFDDVEKLFKKYNIESIPDERKEILSESYIKTFESEVDILEYNLESDNYFEYEMNFPGAA